MLNFLEKFITFFSSKSHAAIISALLISFQACIWLYAKKPHPIIAPFNFINLIELILFHMAQKIVHLMFLSNLIMNNFHYLIDENYVYLNNFVF